MSLKQSQTRLHLGPMAMNGCPHSEQSVTYKGSNASHWRRRCKICGLVEGGHRDRRDAAVAAAVPVPAPPAPAPCWHFRFHWKGSNQFQFRKLCLDCGKVWTIRRPLEVPEKYKTVIKKWSSADFKTRVIFSWRWHCAHHVRQLISISMIALSIAIWFFPVLSDDRQMVFVIVEAVKATGLQDVALHTDTD